MDQREQFEVILTRSALLRFQDEILPHLSANFSTLRVLEINSEIVESVFSLKTEPYRCPEETLLQKEEKKVRYLLYRATRNFEIKIHFLIEEAKQKVFVIDFFPTKMNPTKIKS